MNLRHFFSLLIILFSLICCQKNNIIVIDQEKLKNDWISNDNKFMIIEDSVLSSNFLHLNGPISKYKISNDTITFYSYPGQSYKDIRVLQYKFIELDSVQLKIKEITLNDTAIIQFRKLSTIKKNNLVIKSIEFSSGPCFGDCPVIDLKITEDSILYLFGYRYVKNKGLYKHKLSKQEFSRIQTKVNSLSLDSIELSPICPDAQNLSLFMKTDNDSINISGMINETTNFRLIVLFEFMESLDKLFDMSKSDDKDVQFKDDFNSNWYRMIEKKKNAR